MNDRRILITCLILLLVACMMISCASIIGASLFLWKTTLSSASSVIEQISNPPDEPEVVPETDIMGNPSDPEDEATPSPLAETNIDPETAREMDEIQMQVIVERGLEPNGDFTRGIYTREKVREMIEQDFEEEVTAEEIEADTITLAAFGLLDPDFDLYTFYIDLLSEQIAGFYDQETKEMVVVQGESFGGPERLTYAHEYTHALQDQNYDLENGLNLNEDSCESDSERCAAIQALVEGDASLSELNWYMDNGTLEDQTEILEFYGNLDLEVFDSAPEFIALDFMFPYDQGYTFVESLYDKGGWGSVDRAYQNLPLSTEQILHPERYPDDKPIPVNIPEFDDILGNGWEEIDRGVMGEWYTYLILAKGLDEPARIDDNQAKRAAEGWGGDVYVVYYNADTAETVMVLHSTWDSSDEADEFADAFRDYANGRFGRSSSDAWQGADGYHVFLQQADTTTWILAPDAETAMTVWQSIAP